MTTTIVNAYKGELLVVPRRNQVLIVGGGPSNASAKRGLEAGVFVDWEVWGLNFMWESLGPWADRWFEIHDPLILTDEEKERVHSARLPVYTRDLWPTAAMSVRFPIENVLEMGYQRLFTCTFCYQIALAISLGFSTIGLYGLDFHGGTARERIVERLGVCYWIGVAQGLGIEIQIPPDCPLVRHEFLYGMEYWEEVKDTRRQLREIRDVLTDGVLDDFDLAHTRIPKEARAELLGSEGALTQPTFTLPPVAPPGWLGRSFRAINRRIVNAPWKRGTWE